jgi:hypothetical protein
MRIRSEATARETRDEAELIEHTSKIDGTMMEFSGWIADAAVSVKVTESYTSPEIHTHNEYCKIHLRILETHRESKNNNPTARDQQTLRRAVIFIRGVCVIIV